MAEHIADDGTDVSHAASEAGFLRGVIALLTYLNQSTSAVVSGIHCFPTDVTARAADMQASVTVKCAFKISRLLSWQGLSAILAYDKFGTTAFERVMIGEFLSTTDAYRSVTYRHCWNGERSFYKGQIAVSVVIGIMRTTRCG